MSGTYKRTLKACIVEGCGKPHLAKGLCRAHYKRFQRKGNIDLGHKIRNCTALDCDKKHYALGFCKKHWSLFKSNGVPETKYVIRAKKYPKCFVPGCLRDVFRITNEGIPFCITHYTRYQSGIDLDRAIGNTGELNGNWKGGVSEYKDHYSMKKVRKEIIEERNGICEICGGVGNEIHHKDESKSNHAKENLILCCAKCHRSTFHRKPHKSLFRSLYGMTIREIAEILSLTYNVVYHRHKMGTLKKLLDDCSHLQTGQDGLHVECP